MKKTLWKIPIIAVSAALLLSVPAYAGGFIIPENKKKAPESNGHDSVKIFSASVLKDSEIPSAFPGGNPDAIKKYFEDKYPANRNQGSFGSCWAHASMALAEFYSINHLSRTKDIDLSEEHLVYGSLKTRENPVVGNDEALGGISFPGNDKKLLDYGGNYYMAAQFLNKDFGYVNESVFPYIAEKNSPEFDSDGNLKDDRAELYTTHENNVLHLRNEYETNIHNEDDVITIKKAIMENGAVGGAYHHRLKSYYDNGTTVAFYNNNDTTPDHAVCIVGWDDDYAVSNFGDDKPSKPGAWLVRNSWANEDSSFYSYNRYFWLSYEDKSLWDKTFIFEVTEEGGYDNNYYYDTQIHSTSAITMTGCKLASANIFRVPEGKSEELTEVTVEVDRANDYKLDIYVNPENDNPESGEHAADAGVTGEFPLPGLYTISLNKAVKLSGGDSFSIVFKTDSTTVCCEETDISFFNTCGIKEGQSYTYFPVNMSVGGKIYSSGWYDNSSQAVNIYNYCISAHTRNLNDPGENGNGSENENGNGSVSENGNGGSNDSGSGGSNESGNNGSSENGSGGNGNGGSNESGNGGNGNGGSGENGNGGSGSVSENGNGGSGENGNSGSVSENGNGGSSENGSGGSGSVSENGNGGSGENGNSGSENGNGGSVSGNSSASANTVTELSVADSRGGTEILYFDTVNNTCMTKDGKDVLIHSLSSGESKGKPGYMYSGKKLTPGKESFIVYGGQLFRYKTDYNISFKKNKYAGDAVAVIKWKKTAAPYAKEKKSSMAFTVTPRKVDSGTLSFRMKSDGGIKNLTLTLEDGTVIKVKKKDFTYSNDGTTVTITFRNNLSGTVTISSV